MVQAQNIYTKKKIPLCIHVHSCVWDIQKNTLTLKNIQKPLLNSIIDDKDKIICSMFFVAYLHPLCQFQMQVFALLSTSVLDWSQDIFLLPENELEWKTANTW